MLVAMLPAMLPVLKAEPAMLEAWLNLSHREKASVFMTVKTRAMTSSLAGVVSRDPMVKARKNKDNNVAKKERARSETYRQGAATGIAA